MLGILLWVILIVKGWLEKEELVKEFVLCCG